MPLEILVESHVRALREQRGLALTALAAATGLTKSYLANAETGLTDFRVSQLCRIAQVLDCHLWDLFSVPGERPPCPCQQAPPPEGTATS